MTISFTASRSFLSVRGRLEVLVQRETATDARYGITREDKEVGILGLPDWSGTIP